MEDYLVTWKVFKMIKRYWGISIMTLKVGTKTIEKELRAITKVGSINK